MKFEPSTASNTLTYTTQQHLITSNLIAPTTTPSTTATLSKISLSSNLDAKSTITDVSHVLSPIPNVYQNRSRKTQRSEILTSSPFATHS